MAENSLDKKAEVISGMFDSIASKYDRMNHGMSLGIDRLWRRRFVGRLSKRLPEGATVLDLACGTGDLTKALSRKGYAVTGLDISAEMMEIGKVKCRDLDPQPAFILGSAEEIPFPDSSFDAVTIAFGLRNFDHRAQCLQEIRRVLKPGGQGKSAHGAAAMVPMAIELYARDKAVGERCLKLLCNATTTVDEMVRVLKTKLDASQYGPENDQYLQRYMAAALLKGANNKNAYTPVEPYTVEMCSSANGMKEAELTGGYVYYLYIIANGWDTFQRQIEIFQPYNSEYYKVFNCPAAYAQCKPIVGTWPGLK